MGAAALFLFLSRSQVAPSYRPALLVSGIVVSIAFYHYFMIRHSWEAAYVFADGKYLPTGKPFNDFYRYADWMLTVPLLMVELVAVLGLTNQASRPLLVKLVIAAALMIGLGYPGEVISTPDRWTERVVWGALSSVPFFYILYVLWVELTKSLEIQPPQARRLIEVARLVILITWSVYPIAYALGGTTSALAAKSGDGGDASYVVALQIGYAIADITAKAGFGVLIYFIARAKTEALTDGDQSGLGAAVPAMA
ncbi:hypothetical protein HK102_012638 [Quaeritorhiza haematococci]|nr:hypothetical protein HK102_012638 [Quaeritorhiza haematococci]